MFAASKKPYTAVTVQIDRLTSEQFEEDDVSGIFDLVEVIRIQSSGPTEAARAIRKKLKYGNPHRQLRALVLLDGLIQNAGSRFQRTFVDEPLLERLRLLPRDDVVDFDVRKKCQVLFTQWANAYKTTPGLERIANLYKELPKSSRPQAARAKVLQETERFDSDSETVPSPVGRSRNSSSATPSSANPVTLTHTSAPSFSSSKLSKSKKSGSSKPFNLSREKENMTNTIAQSSIASTNLLNGLQLINRETERVSENPEVVRRFEACKGLRRKILYYIQHVESDDWIGSLVNANDELVKALTAYEINDRSIDDDSDSDAWEHSHQHASHKPVSGPSMDTQQQLAGLSLQNDAPPTKPPRPGAISMPAKPTFPSAPPSEERDLEGEEDDDDDDDPFGDANAAPTPNAERPGMTWREVISIDRALRKSSSTLRCEDRVIDWQKQASGEAGSDTKLGAETADERTPPDDGSMQIRVADDGPDSEQPSRPSLTESNLRAVTGDSGKEDREGSESKQKKYSLKRMFAIISIPFKKTWRGIKKVFGRRKKSSENSSVHTLIAIVPPTPELIVQAPMQEELLNSRPRSSLPGQPSTDDALQESRREYSHLDLAHQLLTESPGSRPAPAGAPSNDRTVSRLGLQRSELERMSTAESEPDLRGSRRPKAKATDGAVTTDPGR